MSEEINFKNIDSLDQVKRVVSEASEALNNPLRTIEESEIPEVLAGVAGAGVGAAIGFGALYGLGTVGLSAVGITSGLATAGAIVGGGMAAGVTVLAAPVAIAGAGVYGLVKSKKHKRLMQLKGELLQKAISLRDSIITELQAKQEASENRLEYLSSLNTMLHAAIKDLSSDLAK